MLFDLKSSMKNPFARRAGFLAAIFFLAANVQLRAQNFSAEIAPKPILDVMQRVGDWQLAHPPTDDVTGWIAAAGDTGLMALAGISGDAKYRDAMLALGEMEQWKLIPTKKYHADNQCIGQTYAELYLLYRDPKMIAPILGIAAVDAARWRGCTE